MQRKLLGPLGVLVALVLFVVAAERYPGGYDWANHSISALFQPATGDGADNAARPLAVLAVLVFCTSMGFVFKRVSRLGRTRIQEKTIEIAGIGSMVYAGLMVTPMHDALVGVALAFFVTAMVTTLRMVQQERRTGMFVFGAACLALTLGNAAMYYGELLYGFLPLVQKTSVALWVGWLCTLQLAERARTVPRRAA